MKVQKNTAGKLFVYLPKEMIGHLELTKGDDLYYKADISDKGSRSITLSKLPKLPDKLFD